MAKKFCTSCGAALETDARFCDGCGVSLNGTADDLSGQHPRSMSTKSKVALAGAALAVIASGAAFWYYRGQSAVAFVPMEAEWQYVSANGEKIPAPDRCRLTKLDGMPIFVHSDRIVGMQIGDPKEIASLPETAKIIVAGNTYTRMRLNPYNFTESLGDWIAADGVSSSGAREVRGNSVLPVADDANVIFVDSTGEIQITPIPHSERATAFSTHGIAGVLYKDGPDGQGKWGIIDRAGAFIISPRFQNFVMINSEVAFAQEGGKWGRIDVASLAANPGGYNFSFEYDGIAPTPNAAIIAVKLAGKWGVIDSDGKELVAPTYDRALPTLSKSYFSAHVGGKWGVFDTTGKAIFAPNYDEPPLIFPDGSDAFALTSSAGKVNWVDMQGKVLRSDSFRLEAIYTNPAPSIIAYDEVNPHFVAEIGAVNDRRFFLVTDRGRSLSKPLTNKFMDGGDHYTGTCVRKPVGDDFG